MIKKAWVKFDGMTVKCICDELDFKCKDDKSCKEYVIKFTEIDRKEKLNDTMRHLKKKSDDLKKTIKKFESQVSKSVKKFKI